MKTFLLLMTAALTAHAGSFYLTVAGLGGEDDYEQRFTGQASDITKLLANEPGAKVVSLSGKDATKENIETKLKEIATQAKAEDTFVLLLIGHGSYDDLDYKLNIPGHDITATDLKALLDKIPARQVVVNATSASGGALEKLQKPQRVVISATKSGTERNATVFARYWIEAFRDAAADTDKNQTLTALEAFNYAQRKVTSYFETQKRLATEHPVLEDTGKGEGVRDPSAANGQGLIAGRLPVLHLGSVASLVNDPKKQELLKQKDALETSIDELKYRKAALDEREYNTKLRQLILELAKVQAGLDQ
jgi:hypothetical protein